MNELSFKIKGEILMMHNGQGKDPLNIYHKILKKLTSKKSKTKTDADYAELARIEWECGLYLFDGQVGVPAEALYLSCWNGAKSKKLGVAWKKGVRVIDEYYPLAYKGETIRLNENENEIPNPALDKFYLLYSDRRSEYVDRKPVYRTRPVFHDWSLGARFAVDENILDKDQVIDIVEYTGKYVGLLEKRPVFGLFDLVE